MACRPLSLPKTSSGRIRATGGPGFLVVINFADKEHWEASDPVGRLGENALSPQLPPFQVQSSRDDEFFLSVKNEVFAERARVLEAPVDFLLNPGNHFDFCPEAIADFLLGRRDSLLGEGEQQCSVVDLGGADPDGDGDGITDEVDNYPTVHNAGQDDNDGDGEGDACDADMDGDNVVNDEDNCSDVQNTEQLDSDDNGIGDACEVPAFNDDSDDDGVTNDVDNCPQFSNPQQEDDDNDGVGNFCDDDLDDDGVMNEADNCVTVANGDQVDLDDDRVGDACDADLDNDDVENDRDNCPLVANETQIDSDGDGAGDACQLEPACIEVPFCGPVCPASVIGGMLLLWATLCVSSRKRCSRQNRTG